MVRITWTNAHGLVCSRVFETERAADGAGRYLNSMGRAWRAEAVDAERAA